MQVIDSHVHFWRIGHNGQAWPGADLPKIHRDFLEADFVEIADGLGVAGMVLVQSQPNDEDTDWLLDLAESSPLVLGVVGWADLAAADGARRVEALARRAKLKGLRPMLQAIAEEGWINREEVAPAVRAMEANGLVFDALIEPRHLPHLRRFADTHPELKVVIDHGAKPRIASRELEPWRTEMATISKRPNVFCKLSGLSSECGPSQPASAVAPYLQEIILTFPPERLLWGSDWPVVNTKSDYREWRAVCLKETAGLPEDDRARIFGRTAIAVYGLA